MVRPACWQLRRRQLVCPLYDFEYLADDSVAFEAAECERLTQNDWSSVDDEAMLAVEAAYRKNARDANRLNGDVKAARASGVGESSCHPSHHLTAPSSATLLATKPALLRPGRHRSTMRKEACVGAYVGKVRTGEEYNKSTHPYDSVYAYKIGQASTLTWSSTRCMRATLLRFMNDCFARHSRPN